MSGKDYETCPFNDKHEWSLVRFDPPAPNEWGHYKNLEKIEVFCKYCLMTAERKLG